MRKPQRRRAGAHLQLLPPPRRAPVEPVVPLGSVPSFGGTLVPSVCDDVLCPVAEAAPEAASAAGAGLSLLGGW
ncbi:MAG TPA: hypothetical protein VL624_03505 [Caldimonas sp.]|jgi:hypothetical protein|nr:hypothetical protein [Caldimonas sp.]